MLYIFLQCSRFSDKRFLSPTSAQRTYLWNGVICAHFFSCAHLFLPYTLSISLALLVAVPPEENHLFSNFVRHVSSSRIRFLDEPLRITLSILLFQFIHFAVYLPVITHCKCKLQSPILQIDSYSTSSSSFLFRCSSQFHRKSLMIGFTSNLLCGHLIMTIIGKSCTKYVHHQFYYIVKFWLHFTQAAYSFRNRKWFRWVNDFCGWICLTFSSTFLPHFPKIKAAAGDTWVRAYPRPPLAIL